MLMIQRNLPAKTFLMLPMAEELWAGLHGTLGDLQACSVKD